MYTPLSVATEFSLKASTVRADKLAAHLSRLDIGSCAITDFGNLSGVPKFTRELSKVGIKPLIGVKLSIYKAEQSDARDTSDLTIICKNHAAWKTLLKIISTSNSKDNFYYKPRIRLEQLQEFDLTNFLCISGGPFSYLGDKIWLDKKLAHNASSYEECRSYADTAHWETNLTQDINELRNMFGNENLFLEVNASDDKLYAGQILSKAVRSLGKKFRLPCVAAPSIHYLDKNDYSDLQILLCESMKSSLRKTNEKILNGEYIYCNRFFKSDNYNLSAPNELSHIYTQSEIHNSNYISTMVEDFKITLPPKLPKFSTPNGKDSDSYLKELCVNGWNNLIKDKVDNLDIYVDRIRRELGVVTEYGLNDYFLIMSDITRFCRENDIMTGPARGSAAGCLISYLSKITYIVDPIHYNLLFERFLNPGRLAKPGSDKFSLPDIDLDIEQAGRPKVIEYIKNTYGNHRVGHVATFGALKGKSAIRAVLRAYEAGTFSEQTECSEGIFSDAAVSDDLQEMEGDKSTILLSLQENAAKLNKFARLNSDGEIVGEWAQYFKQAISLEWLTFNKGVHASAIIIGSDELNNFAPMIRDKNWDELIVGVPHTDAESFSLVKCDILGLSAMDKIKCTLKLINERHFS